MFREGRRSRSGWERRCGWFWKTPDANSINCIHRPYWFGFCYCWGLVAMFWFLSVSRFSPSRWLTWNPLDERSQVSSAIASKQWLKKLVGANGDLNESRLKSSKIHLRMSNWKSAKSGQNPWWLMLVEGYAGFRVGIIQPSITWVPVGGSHDKFGEFGHCSLVIAPSHSHGPAIDAQNSWHFWYSEADTDFLDGTPVHPRSALMRCGALWFWLALESVRSFETQSTWVANNATGFLPNFASRDSGKNMENCSRGLKTWYPKIGRGISMGWN